MAQLDQLSGSRDKLKSLDVGRHDDREVPPVESGDSVSTEPLTSRDDRSIDGPKRQVAVSCHQLGDTKPVGRGNLFGNEVARRSGSSDK